LSICHGARRLPDDVTRGATRIGVLVQLLAPEISAKREPD
jgi:hypothetical protein